MEKNRLVEKFPGLANYRSVSACQLNYEKVSEKKMEEKRIGNYQSVGNILKGQGRDRTKIGSILSQY